MSPIKEELLKRADALLDKLLEHDLQYGQQTGAAQIVDDLIAALRSMPAEPYAYAVYFPDQPTEELVHDLDELLDDMTNREHTVTALFAAAPTEAKPATQPVCEGCGKTIPEHDRLLRCNPPTSKDQAP